MMLFFQILIIVGFVIYIGFSCLNFMETHSEEAIEQFKNERNTKIIIAIIIFILLYFCDTFNLIF